ncbi:hypothetical protein [Streptomyces sp. 6N223]|uniref:hypothetical protein n=1 Tax=Streptomyces sp. 6N223 TaxID=3457412 RepID=UPI003FD42957
MPHPTPVQIAYGSATVIFTTLLLMLVVPTGSTVALVLIALVALALGVVVALAAQCRRDAGVAAGGEPSAMSAPSYEAAAAAPAPAPAVAPAQRPEVSV